MSKTGEKAEKSILKSIAPGERLRLRDDVLNYMETREWVLKKIEKDGEVVLVHEKGIYGISVKEADIDWDEYQRRRFGKVDVTGIVKKSK